MDPDAQEDVIPDVQDAVLNAQDVLGVVHVKIRARDAQDVQDVLTCVSVHVAMTAWLNAAIIARTDVMYNV